AWRGDALHLSSVDRASLALGRLRRLGDADHGLRDARPGVSGRLTAIIGLGVDDEPSADDRILRSGERDVLDGDLVLGDALFVRLEVAEIARVARARLRKRVHVPFGVVVIPGGGSVRRGDVAELVD